MLDTEPVKMGGGRERFTQLPTALPTAGGFRAIRQRQCRRASFLLSREEASAKEARLTPAAAEIAKGHVTACNTGILSKPLQEAFHSAKVSMLVLAPSFMYVFACACFKSPLRNRAS